jgi:hypothetical protein
MRNTLLILFVLFSFVSLKAQSNTAKVTDADTGEGLPFASVQIDNNQNLTTNDDGNFILPEKTDDNAPVIITYIGYKSETTTIAGLKNNPVVKLKAGVYELENINITNAIPDPETIMASVKKNLTDNYKSSGNPVKNKLFYRESSSITPLQIKVDIKESTGFTKTQLKDMNKELTEYIAKLIKNPPREFTDMLCNYYTGVKEVDGKKIYYPKLEVIKATKLRDKDKGASLNEVGQESIKLLAKHLDTTKYYRAKSGLFGSRDTIQLSDKKGKHTPIVKKTNKERAIDKVQNFVGVNTLNAYSFNFITNPALYEYEYKGAMPSDEGQVYILDFKPRKGKAKYTGTIYISNTDFAVLRTDFELAKGKTLGGVNLKFLLGVKQSENVSRGTLIFKKKSENSNYYLQYASRETGEYIYMNRPIKFIEITEGDKDIFEFDLKFEANMLDKEEYFNMMRTDINDAEFDGVKQPDFNYIYLSSYNPGIWKEYGGLEPLEEMKQFKPSE